SKLIEPYKTIVGRALAKDPAQRPGRLYELLSPEDAPKNPSVRFIGDGKVAPPLPPDLVIEDEEVLRIGPEEPVFYIGPDTRPPRPGRAPPARGGQHPPGARRDRGGAGAPPPGPPPPPGGAPAEGAAGRLPDAEAKRPPAGPGSAPSPAQRPAPGCRGGKRDA